MPLERNRRRIDHVTDPEFVADLRDLGITELRERRRLCDELDTELSYYRRLLHGRLDLLNFEQSRRRGEETRTLIEALPEILAGHDTISPTRSLVPRSLPIEAPDMGEGRRPIDRVLGDDFLTHLPSISDAELDEIEETLSTTEHKVSTERRAVYDALEQILEELTRRYRDGLADADQLLRHG
jgi:hypothetical protein